MLKFLSRYIAKKRELARFRRASTAEVFTYIHERNKWGDASSRSGSGSTLERTDRLRQELPGLLRALEVRSLLDLPCGDFFWMQHMELPVEQYIGADIVDTLVEENRRHYGGNNRRFQRLDLLTDPLPPVDAILCRDCLVHFSFRDIQRALDNIRASGATWLLTTHFPDIARNVDIVTGKHRALNLTRPPLSWPAPRQGILEYDAGPRRGRKYLALWRIADLPMQRANGVR